MARGVAGAGDGAQRGAGNLLAIFQQHRGPGDATPEPAAHLGLRLGGIKREIARQQPGFPSADGYLDAAHSAQGGHQRVEAAHMVLVGVGEHDAPHGCSESAGGGEDAGGAAGQTGVDGSQRAVGFTHEEGAESAEAYQLVGRGTHGDRFHKLSSSSK